MNYCPQCGAPVEPNATSCKSCGKQFVENQGQNQNGGQYQNQQQYQNGPQYNNGYSPNYSNINPNWPIKNKIAAGLFGILLGGLGIHKFYLGKVGLGIVYILFCWTGIPSIIGLIEGIIYLCSSDEEFMMKNEVRVFGNNNL